MNEWLDPCRTTFGPILATRRDGEISPAESEGLDRHLAECPRCRALTEDLEILKGVLVEAVDREPLDHPEPEALAALATGTASMAPAERQRLEGHLATCATCRSEWSVVRSWTPPVPAPRRSFAVSRALGWFGAGVAAAAAVFSVVVFWPLGVEPGGVDIRPSTAPTQIRGSHHRASDEPTTVRVPPSGDVLVSLTIEAAARASLRVDLLRPNGSVAASRRLVNSDPSGLLFVSVPFASFPRMGGTFRVTVEATGETFTYPFRVEAEAE